MTTLEAPPRRSSSRLVPLLPIAVLSTAFGAIAGTTVDAVLPSVLFALAWGALAIAVAPRLARKGAHSAAWANAPILAAAPLALIVLGGAVLGQLLSTSPRFALLLFQQPDFGVFFYAVHVLFEWLLLPAALMLNWHDRRRRNVLVVAATVFYLGRVASALYFAPNAMEWGRLPSGEPEAALLDDIRLWVDLNWIRLALQDTLTAALLAVAVFRSGRTAPPLSDGPPPRGSAERA